MKKTLALTILFAAILLIVPRLATAGSAGPSPGLEEGSGLAANGKIYFGAAVPNFADLAKFESDARKKVSIFLWFQQWGGTNSSFNPALMNQVRNHGSIPLLSWEPWKGQAYGKNQ